MTQWQMVLYVLIAAGMTILVRSLPFLVFSNGHRVPPFVLWMGRRLPAAAMAMLVVYCLKDLSFVEAGGWIPAVAAGSVTVLLHMKYRKMILSICGGTMLYMLLTHLL